MKYLDLSFPSPEENLALDEALLDQAEDGLLDESLRFWQSKSYFVVLGYSRKVKLEVDQDACQKHQIPILRRPSGGGTVLQGPGSMNYSLILNIKNTKPLANLIETNRYILERNKKALAPLMDHQEIFIQGTSDLTLGHLKFSGNAQRRKKHYILYHGTFLLDFNLSLIEKTLKIPKLQPPYRKNRAHEDFLINLKIPETSLKAALLNAWDAGFPLENIPHEKMNQLVKERYSKKEWNEKF